MSSQIDPYKTLGLSKEASQDEIKKAYRKLARKYHPDVNPGDKAAEDKFKELSEAYDILSDAGKKQEYDRLGQDAFYSQAFGGSGYQRPDFNQGFPFADIFGDLFGNMSGGGGIKFSSSQGFGGERRTSRAKKGQDISYKLKIGFKEAALGTETVLDLQIPGVCPKCSGQGLEASGGGVRTCSSCNGSGEKLTRQTIKAKIPAGINEGQKIRLAGKGSPGENGGPNGDLYLEVAIGVDKKFSRQGNDVYLNQDISLYDALLGTQLEIETLNGRARLKLPSGTANGAKMRLKGQGITNAQGKTGDLYVVCQVIMPQKLSTEAKALVEELKSLAPVDMTQP